MSLALLIAGIAALIATLLVTIRVRHPAALSIPIMTIGWLVAELPLLHLALQVLATVVLVGLGALDSASGWVGLVAMVLSWIGLGVAHRVAQQARPLLAGALARTFPEAADRVRLGRPDRATLRRPFHFDKTGIDVSRGIEYGPDEDHRLDLYRPADSDGPAPVMVYLHGGGWVSGSRKNQGLPLIHALVRAGWVCATIDYRLGAKHRFPAPVDDVQLALAWVHDHIGEHGGTPSFVAVSGGSAGGHLAALAALSPDSRQYVNACVPVYGVYDFTDHLDIRGYARMRPFLERMVMPTKLRDDRELWEQSSPIFQVRADAPPFLVLHGKLDVFAWREEARVFAERLASESEAPVIHAELPGAHHAFDIFHSVRCVAAVDAIVAFCDAARDQAAIRPTEI